MGHTLTILEEIREQHKANAEVLAEARRRRDTVFEAARAVPGVLRVFSSGSIAHETVNDPVVDADGGIVLDRRLYPGLGPDGAGVGPIEIVHSVAAAVRAGVVFRYPQITIRITKRAIEVSFHEPMGVPGSPTPQQDPSVDLIVGLTRSGNPGLWIPNTETASWDPSDPETHTDLFQQGDHELRRTRRRAIRLSKLMHRQYGDPLPITSFNQEAIGHAAVLERMSIAHAFLAICEIGASQLAAGLTPDPAGVSPPLKCPEPYLASQRYQTSADRLRRALARDADENAVRAELEAIFFLLAPVGTSSKARLAAALRSAVPVSFGATGLGLQADTRGINLKPVHSFGDTIAS
jgi:hypothetical protein